MARQIRLGDTVQGFLRPDIKGTVVAFDAVDNKQLTVGATSADRINVCIVKIEKSDQHVSIPLSEVFIVEY